MDGTCIPCTVKKHWAERCQCIFHVTNRARFFARAPFVVHVMRLERLRHSLCVSTNARPGHQKPTVCTRGICQSKTNVGII